MLSFSVTDFRVKDNFKVWIQFYDGASGEIDFSTVLQQKSFFEKFKDLQFFLKVSLDKEIGTLVWPNNIDIAPERLYEWATHKPAAKWIE